MKETLFFYQCVNLLVTLFLFSVFDNDSVFVDLCITSLPEYGWVQVDLHTSASGPPGWLSGVSTPAKR
jgi:hypothetical protein